MRIKKDGVEGSQERFGAEVRDELAHREKRLLERIFPNKKTRNLEIKIKLRRDRDGDGKGEDSTSDREI